VAKRFFAQGEQQGGTNYYYLRDHLGSVREMVSSSGSIVSEATYDPYGVATVSGSVTPTFQYAGYYAHQGSGLNLTWYRGYDPVIGRWLARDPIGYEGGINLFRYVGNGPIIRIDSFGLQYFQGGSHDTNDPEAMQKFIQDQYGEDDKTAAQRKNDGGATCKAFANTTKTWMSLITAPLKEATSAAEYTEILIKKAIKSIIINK
jgi:RHS repeat-associated protein